jgi:hypothetical protein
MTIHPDIRGALGRQRQAELIAQAERERLAQQVKRDPLNLLRRLVPMIRARARTPRAIGATDGLPEAEPLLETD